MCNLLEAAEQSNATKTTTMDAQDQSPSVSSLAPTSSRDDESQLAGSEEDANEEDTLSTGSPRDPTTSDKHPKW
jgi:hypothetical protein